MRRGKERATSSEEDYGFNYPFALIERLFWERRNSNSVTYPDEGSMLDQDEALMTDLDTYGWLVSFAENIIDKEEQVKQKLKDLMRNG